MSNLYKKDFPIFSAAENKDLIYFDKSGNQEKYLNNWMGSNNATISDLVDQGSNIVWDKSAGTYYYRFALYLDLPRKLGRISKEFTYTNTTNNIKVLFRAGNSTFLLFNKIKKKLI